MEISEISNVSSERKNVKIFQTAAAAAADNQTSSETVDCMSENLISPQVCETSPLGSYVVVEESSKMWVGYVDHRDEEFGDYHVQFLHPSGVNKSYSFPDNNREQCFKCADQIIGILPNPTLTNSSRIRYSFPNEKLVALMLRS